MIRLPGYEIKEKVYEEVKTVLYRGVTNQDKHPVIIKVIQVKYPSVEDITNLRQEYKILKSIDHAGVIKCYKIESYQDNLALILEDFGGQPLSQLLQVNQQPLNEFLTIAISLAEILIQIHKVPIIHKNIKTSNIFINPKTKQVKLTGFSSAITLTREQQTISKTKLPESSLAYISPEQTGRMNRSLDYRTDLYSLGITFYEMLTGIVPFTTTDPIELVHYHIAKQPVQPSQKREIPKAVSDIVMKLLAKNAEDRYQSAAGLKFDLENCLLQLQNTGTIEDFPLGRRDRGNQLLIPQKLYGREKQVQTLLDAFARVTQGTTEMMLVSGYSGIGKTSIVHEVHKPIVEARGYFIAGKFDQLKRDIPYAAFIQAFQELISQLLTENQQKIALWKEKLLNALASNGQVIINVIPEVELIIGTQPEVPQLGASESENRFHQVFQQFINVFCQPEHPLVIFLDDLQWVDAASLKLIQLLLADNKKFLLLIGAYRDNEVSSEHSLTQTLEKIKSTGVVINNITVEPLSSIHIAQMIKESLIGNLDADFVKILAELIFSKTQGNPFFLTQLIKTLYSEKLLVYLVYSDSWQWNIAHIQAIGITDYNIVELIARNICKLPPDTQKVLKLAACIGNSFNLEILAIVNEKSSVATAQEILPAIQAGLILPQSDTYKIPLVLTESEATSLKVDDIQVNYKFLHDRVQQAAYSLIPDCEKKVTHQKIGQLLLKNTILQEQKDNIFTLVNQLNFGRDLLINYYDKSELAKLNFVAGHKAKMATAYEAAINYFNVALELLELDSPEEDDLIFVLYLKASETQYLNTNFAEAARLCNIGLKQGNTILKKVKFYEIKIRIALAQNQIQLAIETGLLVLEMLEVSLCQSSPEELNFDELAKLPRMTDPYKLAAMESLMLIHPPACFAESALGLTILYTMIELSRQYGNSPPSINAYAVYGALVSWYVPDIDCAYQLGQLAWLVLAQLDAKEFECQLLVTISLTITHWKKHTKETIEPLFSAIQSGLEVGDIEFACYAAHYYSIHLFFNGYQLQYVQDNQKRYINFIKNNKQEHQLYLIKICSQLVANLLCQSVNKLILDGEFTSETETLLTLQANNNFLAMFSLYFAKSLIYYLFKKYTSSIEYAITASKASEFIQGEIIFTQHNFYYSLALLGQYSHASSQANLGNESEQEQFLMQVERNQEKMKYWAHHCPMNYQHKYELVEAEKARVLGQILIAMEYYDRAIQGARVQGYIQEEAVACERAAEFYLGLGREEIAQLYMKNAHHCYTRWGAIAKVKDLESEYPQFLAEVTNRTEVESTSLNTTSSDSEVLDLTTVIKASQALASEIVLEKLLEELMKIAIENAGAQKGYLILDKQGNWVIEAQGNVNSDDVNILQSIPVDSVNPEIQVPLLSTAIINYVARTQENVVLNDAVHEGQFTRDPYIVATQPKSILCTPLLYKGKLSGILYLENNLTTSAFTSDRVEVLKILSAQAAISIENSRLYEQLEDYNRTLEQKVKTRTQELEEKNQDLASLLQKLKATQAQIIAQEKLASLGALTAGIAHEIKNPLNFVNNFAELSVELTQELLEEIENQQDRLNPESREYIEEILNDLKQNAQKINEHGKRADNIVHGMLMHSRGQTGDRQQTDINAMLAEAISLTYHGMRAKDAAFNIVIETNYGDNLGLINVVPQNISRAFINIINNACYAAYKKKMRFQAEGKAEEFLPRLIVSTKDLGKQVEIHIRDNGGGIPQKLRDQIFNPFFTTKPPGEGTGLGLSITHDIIVQQHQGNITVESEVNSYTLFIITLPKTFL
ncbi:AAA family ATPase [Tolypothrix campylonemoides VB511288]|nr:AAA family ATPase [Tolypothrix campylonemoides VB511288]